VVKEEEEEKILLKLEAKIKIRLMKLLKKLNL